MYILETEVELKHKHTSTFQYFSCFRSTLAKINMRRNTGFRMKHKWCFWKTKPCSQRCSNPTSCARKALFKICNWFNFRGICYQRPGIKYTRLDHDRAVSDHPPPKGHLAVYVGVSDRDKQRYTVPAVYLNHPMFGGLLKEAEKVFGFNHSGGIQIPCQVSEFETIRSRIASSCQ